MSVIKLTKKNITKKEDDSNKIKLKRSDISYNSSVISGWESSNKDSQTSINDYYTRIKNGDYLSSNDLSSFRKALDTYIDSSTRLRQLNEISKGTDGTQASAPLLSSNKSSWTPHGLRSDIIEGKKSDLEKNSWNTYIDSVNAQYDEIYNYYSQFDTKEKYDEAVAYQKEQKRLSSLDIPATQAKIDSANSEISRLQGIYDKYFNEPLGDQANRYNYITNAPSEYKNLILDEAKKEHAILNEFGVSSMDDLKKTLNSRMSELKTAIQDDTKLINQAKRVQDKANLTDNALNAEDFEKYSQIGASIENPTAQESEGSGLNIFGYQVFGEEAKDIGNIVTFSKENADLLGLGEANGGGSSQGARWIYSLMTDEEVDIYNYYLAKHGKDEAQKYLDTIEKTLQARHGGLLFEDIEDKWALELVFGSVAGLDQFASGAKNLFSNDDYIVPSATQVASGLIREDLGNKDKDGDGIADGLTVFGSSIGQSAYDMVTTTTNMLPSILLGSAINTALPGAGSAVGAITLGASASGNAYTEMLNLGYNKSQARAYSALVGASEAGLQYVLGGIGSLGGKISSGAVKEFITGIDNAFARAAITLGGNMLSEGAEESLQTILEPWFKSIATNTDYEAPDFEEVLYSGLLGALSAGILEGPNIGVNELSTYRYGKQIKNAGALDRLTKVGSTFAADSVAYKLAGKVNEKTGAYTLGRLLNEVNATLTEQNMSEIVTALEKKGVDTSSAQTISKWLYAAVEGEPFTKKQIAALENNKIISQVLNDVILNQNSTVNQRINGYNQTLEAIKTQNKKAAKPTKAAENITQTRKPEQTNLNTSETETALSAKYSISDDGKTTLKSSGEEISVKEISTIKNGEIFLRLDNGNVVNAKDVDFGAASQALLYDAVTDMNAASANAMISGYVPSAGTDVSEYILGFKEAYKYGAYNFPVSEMSTDGFSGMLTESQKHLAYNLGKIDAKASAKKAQELKNKAKNDLPSKKKGKLILDTNTDQSTLTERQKTSLKTLEVLAESLGVDIHIFESETNEKGEHIGKNGWYDPSNNSIHIDLYAGISGNDTLLFTAAHELTHFIREWSPEKFKVFADFLMEQYGRKGVSVETLVQGQILKAKNNGREIGYDAAYEEVIADSCESFLVDSDAIKQLASKDKGLWEKIKSYIRDLVAKINNAYKKLKPDSFEGRCIYEMKDAAEMLHSLWTDALVDASENFRSLSSVEQQTLTDTDNNTNKKNVMYSFKGYTDKQKENWKSAKRIVLYDNDLQFMDFIKESRLNNSFNKKMYFGAIPHDLAVLIKSKTGIDIENFNVSLSAYEIRKIFKDHGDEKKESTRGQRAITENDIVDIPRVIQSPEDIRLSSKRYEGKHVIEFDKRINDSRFSVAAVVSDKHLDLFVQTAYIGTKKGNLAVPTGEQAPINTPKANNGTVSDNRIPQTDDSVNSKYSLRDPELMAQRNEKGSYSDKVLFSERNNESFSNRYLLANALESVAQNDIELKKLQEYKSKIMHFESEHTKLVDIRARIKELSFSKGKRDTATISELQQTATKIANRINIYDRQLLNLESTKALKGVIEREKQKAYRKALTKYRQDRPKTAMKLRIKSVVNELNHLLLHGSKERNIKLDLQPAVAAALQAINFDTVAADERVARINELIANATDPEIIESLTESRDRIQAQGDAMASRLEVLRRAYADFQENNNSSGHYLAEVSLIMQRIDSVITKVGNTPLRNMSLSQLEEVYDLYRMVLTTVRNVNALFKEGKIEDLHKNVSSMMMELSKIPTLKGERWKGGNAVRSYSWNEMIPAYAFERIGSRTFTDFFWEVVNGQNTFAVDVNEANDFSSQTREKFGYKKWDLNKIYEFALADGRTLRVTLKHMMSIYAYSKRPQALEHMRVGGFFFNDKETFRKKGGVLELIKSDEEGYCVDQEVLAEIKKAMTVDQLQYVDSMQEYLTRMGEKGNEVSRVLWGIDLFKEKIYFPLKSSKQFIASANQPVQETSLKNDGMTKEIRPGANNPIVLEAFDDVWAAHVNRMSQYHAFVLPIENLNKIHNYGTWANTPSMSVSTMLEGRYGSAVNDYITNFIRDLNGSSSVGGAPNPIIGYLSKFKKTAVAASASVVVQQPTAVLRATAVIDAKYFAGKPNMKLLSKKWDELKRYAPIAIIKEIGGFDAGAGRQAVAWLNTDTLQGIDKARNTIDELTMKGAAIGDMIGWCTIWEAVKRETKAKTNLKAGSDEFLKKAGERFTQVVVLTQVYDSTLSRSGYMRSKHDSVKMLTSFMGEPTVSFNMLFNAVYQAKNKRISKKSAIRTIGAVYASVIAASAASSLIYALRDDNEDESYLKKFDDAFSNKILSDLNPVGMLPVGRDFMSILEGWDVERTDIAVFQDLYNAVASLDSDNKSAWRKVEDFAGAIAVLFGLPVKNVMRSAREMYNAFKLIFDDALKKSNETK